MRKISIGVESVTAAIKARKLLRAEGINSKLLKVDTISDTYGCSHALEIAEADFFAAVAALRRASLAYRTLGNE